jgi:predicted site-specific integrase-resolvase
MTHTISKTTTTDLLTVQEIADILRVDESSVRRWIKLGILNPVILPHANKRQVYRITREELDRVLNDTVVPTRKVRAHA